MFASSLLAPKDLNKLEMEMLILSDTSLARFTPHCDKVYEKFLSAQIRDDNNYLGNPINSPLGLKEFCLLLVVVFSYTFTFIWP